MRNLGQRLAGVHEVCQFAGVTRRGLANWREQERDAFPAPIARLAAGPVWDLRDVEKWLEARRQK